MKMENTQVKYLNIVEYLIKLALLLCNTVTYTGNHISCLPCHLFCINPMLPTWGFRRPFIMRLCSG